MLETKVSSPQHSGLPSAALVGIPAAVVLVGFLAQCATYLNHDVAWVLYSSGRMLDGAVFGSDIVAANPPLIWWISLIPNAAARLLNLPVIATFRVFTLLLVAGALIASDRILAAGHVSRGRRVIFLATAAYLLTLGIDRDFGQREHITVVLVLPYVLAIAYRMRGGQMPWERAALIGAAGGIGIAFKPYFLIVPFLLEAALLWRRKEPRLIIRPEVVAAAGTFLIYSAALLIFASPWLLDAIPQISRVYWAFEQGDSSLLTTIAMQFAVPLMGLALVLVFNRSDESVTLALAAAGFLAAAMIQGKYYTYHVYPAASFILLAFAVGIPNMPAKWRAATVTLATLAFAIDSFDSGMALFLRSDRGAYGHEIAEMSAFVDQQVPSGGSFLAISTHPFPAFPTALYAHREWASASNSDLFLPAVVRLREGSAPPNPELLRFAESRSREAMLRDLSKRPQLVLIDVNPYRHAIGASDFDFLQFYSEDPKFDALWATYFKAPSAPPGYDAYVRRRGS